MATVPQNPVPAADTLLLELGVRHAPVDEQRTAVALWLGAHVPSLRLAHSLRRRGFGDLLG